MNNESALIYLIVGVATGIAAVAVFRELSDVYNNHLSTINRQLREDLADCQARLREATGDELEDMQ